MNKNADRLVASKMMNYMIDDMQSYGHDDSYIIEWFIENFNFTRKDFRHYGYGEFVKDYYAKDGD